VLDKEVISTAITTVPATKLILFLEKGKRNLNDRSETDIITARAIRGRYPYREAVSVSEILIRRVLNSVKSWPILSWLGFSRRRGHPAWKTLSRNDKSRKAVALATRRLRSCMKSREEVILSRANAKSYSPRP